MNILFVTGVFAKNEKDLKLGGMCGAVYKSALGMQRRGHNVRILAVSDRDRNWNYRGLDVISIRAQYRIDEEGVWNNLRYTIKREYKIESAIRMLQKEKPIDIIQYTGWFGIGLLHYSNIPAVMRISSYTKVQLENNYSRMRRIFLETVEYLAARRMNFIFAPGRIMANGIGKDVHHKIGVIETPFLRDEIEWDECIIQSKLKDKRYLLFFGRLSIDKGIYVIRDALYRILKSHPDIYFVFAGYSSENNGVKIETELSRAAKEYKDRLIFLGLLPKDKLFPVVNCSEIVVMPSLADNFPNACAEAMSMGKIVIGTNGSSLEQFIESGRNGYLAEIGSADSLYDCIECSLNLDVHRKQYMSKQAEKRIQSLNLDQYSKRMESLYRKIIYLTSKK